MNTERAFTFISGAVEPWRSPWLSRQQVMSRLKRRHRVVHLLPEETADQALSHMALKTRRPRAIERLDANLYEFRPPALFPKIYAADFLDRASGRLRAWHLRRWLGRRGWNDRILYLWHPRFHELIGRAGERLSVFHCHDYYPAYHAEGTLERKRSEADFNAIVRRADVVFVASERLMEKVSAMRTSGVHLVPSAVDFEAIRGRILADGSLPADLAGQKKPVIAHVGRINKKVDFELLTALADRRPDWSIGVIGPKTGWPDDREKAFQSFLKRPNAFYRRGAPHPDFAAYLNAISVGLMAYRLEGTWMEYGSPLKIFEYFAAGKPVVSADVPTIRRFVTHLSIARTVDEWLSAIDAAMRNDSNEKMHARIAIAKENSWEERCERILRHIHASLDKTEPVHAA